jgi:hypothetical protein
MLERVGYFGALMSPCCSSHMSRSGSTLPDRVAMTRPSTGVKPIVVSTDRPADTAASEAPAQRWHVTILRVSGRRSRSAAVRRAA